MQMNIMQINSIIYLNCLRLCVHNIFYSGLCFLSEAFQRARRKMQEARETLPRDLISSTSLLKTESSA